MLRRHPTWTYTDLAAQPQHLLDLEFAVEAAEKWASEQPRYDGVSMPGA